jgi:hypothetical protein
MKAIHPHCRRLLGWASVAFIVACGDARRRAFIRADGEIFESVARSQVTDSASTPSRTTSALRFDSRPAGDNAELAGAPDRPAHLELTANGDSLADDALDAIVEQRKDILQSVGIEEGGPFDYPLCGGALTRRTKGSTVVLPVPKCPGFVRRYLTVGLPYRGVSPILERVRPAGVLAPDSTGESWTVLVTESSVGPGGQQWRQYVSLFHRDPGSGRLSLAERFLLSWAE